MSSNKHLPKNIHKKTLIKMDDVVVSKMTKGEKSCGTNKIVERIF